MVEAAEPVTTPVYQDKAYLEINALLPQERDGRVRVAYDETVVCVTGTHPPVKNTTGQHSTNRRRA